MDTHQYPYQLVIKIMIIIIIKLTFNHLEKHHFLLPGTERSLCIELIKVVLKRFT